MLSRSPWESGEHHERNILKLSFLIKWNKYKSDSYLRGRPGNDGIGTACHYVNNDSTGVLENCPRVNISFWIWIKQNEEWHKLLSIRLDSGYVDILNGFSLFGRSRSFSSQMREFRLLKKTILEHILRISDEKFITNISYDNQHLIQNFMVNRWWYRMTPTYQQWRRCDSYGIALYSMASHWGIISSNI